MLVKDMQLFSVMILLRCLTGNDRFLLVMLGIGANLVLIDVDTFEHLRIVVRPTGLEPVTA